MELEPVGSPINILVSLSDEILPDPDAILVTGITPQKTRDEGYSEADFLKVLAEQVATPGTTIVGFNSVRFDDEYMRYTLYRNFYDPYEWQWKDSRSRWDLLDVVRMTRALRPEGIEWPTDDKGQPTNRLELLTAANKLDHFSAHDAMSDVNATIAVARLIKQKQPKLFEYLLAMRTKQKVGELVNLSAPQPFVYTSGRYPKETLHTTVAFPVAPGGTPGTVIVYDLRHDPNFWKDKTVADLKKARFAPYEERQKEGFMPLPAKELTYTKCPVVAPLGVLDGAAQARIQLDVATVERNLITLQGSGLGDKLREVFAREPFAKITDVDGQLYDGFFNDADKVHINAVRNADARALADFHPNFGDPRLAKLLLRYKARNHPGSLSKDELQAWEAYRSERLQADLPKFMNRLQQLAGTAQTDQQQFLLQELQLWAESLAPGDI